MLIVVLTWVLAVFEWILTTTWASNTPIVGLSSLVVLAVTGVAVAVSSPIKRASRRSLEREPERWLVERQQCPDGAQRLQQRRASTDRVGTDIDGSAGFPLLSRSLGSHIS